MKITRFRVRLFIILLCALMLPVAASSTYIFVNSQNDLLSYTSGNIQAMLDSNALNIEAKLDILDDASKNLQIALAKIPRVVDPDTFTTTLELYNSTLQATTVYSSFLKDTSSIDGFDKFYIYFPEYSSLLVSGMTYYEDVSSNVLDCHALPDEKWGLSRSYEFAICNPSLGAVTKERNFAKNFYMDDIKGNRIILTANLSERYVNRLIYAGLQIKPDYAVVIDRFGVPLSSKEQGDLGVPNTVHHEMIAAINEVGEERYHEITLEGSRYLLNWTYSTENDWYYVTATSVDNVLLGSSSLPEVFPIMAVAIVAFAVLLMIFIVRKVNNSARLVDEAITKYSALEFDYRIKTNHKSELGYLYSNINEFAQNIGSYVAELNKQKTNQTVAAIQVLQAEINPHMLYNSLESLYSIAKINAQEEIAELVMAMSRFFRIALSGGKRSVKFREAFELANQYITVQNIRVDHIISFSYDIDEEAYEVSVPKFVLQPLVENSIIHGFKNVRGERKLGITAKLSEGWLIISVWDNGIGINETDLEKLNRRLLDFDFEDVSGKGYALRNLNYQIKLKYGEQSSLSLESIYGEGTTAVIALKLSDE